MNHSSGEHNLMGKIRGKIWGALLGLAFGGPWGGLLGLLIGHAYDIHQENNGVVGSGAEDPLFDGFAGASQQAAFTMGVVVLGAKMAKADGRVTRAEIEAFKSAFRVTEAEAARIGHLFDRARRSADGYEPYALQLAHLFRAHPAVLEEVLSGLFRIAVADSAGLSPAELSFLRGVAVIFRFSPPDFARIAARSGVRLPEREKPRDEVYDILGVKEDATADEIKAAYRALIREHHPDRLVAQGLPPEFIAAATEKMKRINAAYDTLCKRKGIK